MSRFGLGRRTILAAVLVLAALVVLLFLMGTTPRETIARTSNEVSSGPTHTGPSLRQAEVAPPIVDASPEAEPDPATAPPGTVVFRRATLDDWRLEQGLPIVSPALAAMDEFRRERPEDRRDPELHALYVLDRDIYRTKLLAEHENHERERFLRDTTTVSDPTWKGRMLKAAEDHGELSETYTERVDELQEMRAKLVHTIIESRRRGTP